METKQYAVPEGCKITSVAIENNNVIVKYECAEPQFKKGDFVFGVNSSGKDWIGIFKNGDIDNFEYFSRIVSNVLNYNDNSFITIERLATSEEKQLLIDKMRENGKDWDFEKMEVVDYVEMIEVCDKVWYICFNGKEYIYKCSEIVTKKRNYSAFDFKNEQLAQIACYKLNEVLKTLKHY